MVGAAFLALALRIAAQLAAEEKQGTKKHGL